MKELARLRRILWVVVRHRLFDLGGDWNPPLALALCLAPLRMLPAPKTPRGERLRLALESLGPIYVKFGQLLSTRRDLLPPDIADELRELQDNVPPFAATTAVGLVESALGAPLDQHFAWFDTEPLASASIAQVHLARLPDGDEVCVKVIRPGIGRIIAADLRLLHRLARLAERHSAQARRLRLTAVVADYDLTIHNELDLRLEAGNTAQLRRNFAYSPLLYVPQVQFELTRQNVLVTERIHGIPIADIQGLRAAGVDLRQLALRGVEIFFTQLFEHNFFHADMHPGNIFVDVTRPDSPRYIAIDCAIIGSLSQQDQHYMASTLYAFFQRDYHEVARLHVESGWVDPDTRVHDFENAIRSVCEPIFAKPLREISLGYVLIYLFQTAQRFNMEVQPQLVLLQKTLLNIEGLGRELYPELDLWETAYPFLKRWMHERHSPIKLWQAVRDQAPRWLDRLPELPELGLQALDQRGALERQQIVLQGELSQLRGQMKRQARVAAWWRITGVLVLGAAGIWAMRGALE